MGTHAREATPDIVREIAASARDGTVVFLTGAGISAESGIPTFRGPEGYWTIGSRVYQPEDMATYGAFRRMRDEVWAWYLWRRAVCRSAAPNAAHLALARLDAALGERFLLVTQNVDGLHGRAGGSQERTFTIHGDIDRMRCGDECSAATYPVPSHFDGWARERRLAADDRGHLACPRCGAATRPHVLWFDETYDEPRYRWDSAHRAAREAALLVVVGTSGATTLPLRMGELVAKRGVPIVAVNAEPSPFTQMALAQPRGWFLEGTAGALVPPLAAALAA